MSDWVQQLLVIGLVGLCAAFVVRQLIGAVRCNQSGTGGCCCHGCPAAKKTAQRVVFLPADSLRKRRR